MTGPALRIAAQDRAVETVGLPKTPLASRLAVRSAEFSSRALQLLPEWLVRRGSNVLADLAFSLSRRYRPNAVANLRVVLGERALRPDLEAGVRAAFRASARCSAELLLLQGGGFNRLEERVRIVDGSWAYLDEALELDRGVVLLTAHLGAFDLLCQLIARRGHPVTAVVRNTMSRPKFDAAMALRRAGGVDVREANSQSVRSMVQTLRRGACLAFLSDRDFFGNGVPVSFFGKPTTLPSSAVRLARETGAPIMAGYLLRAPNGGYDLMLERPFLVLRGPDKQADIGAGMDRVVASLTRAISRAPEQWAVFQPVWPETPARH